ncbi:MAG TPA: phenylalanine--tRNA ligase subunit alpha, partial [Candidatus Sumerlaeia bacterium]|nr:phenylalanine--tRNA ligase subunit alpha [Candidatus Sumerlaeia bacterium]
MLDEIKNQLKALLPYLEADLARARSTADLEEIRVAFLGKKGQLTAILKSFASLDPAERPAAGKLVNEAKNLLLDAIEKKALEFRESEYEQLIESEKLDISLPGTAVLPGRRHPVSQVLSEIESIFTSMGFAIAEGPDVEDEYHNFEALNTPKEHPARDLHDTFYVEGGFLLRTHTSPVQIRIMQNQKPPICIIAPGKVYRVDQDV